MSDPTNNIKNTPIAADIERPDNKKRNCSQSVFEPPSDCAMEVDQDRFTKLKRKREHVKENIDCAPPSKIEKKRSQRKEFKEKKNI